MVRFIRSHAITLAAAVASVVLVAGPPLAAAPQDPTKGSWNLRGNAGTDPVINFLGTTDNKALILRVNNTQGWELEPTGGTPNIIGGFSGNSAGAGVSGATIGGGGAPGQVNTVTGNFGTVGGGVENTVSFPVATVAGGFQNTSSETAATVGGGIRNTASADNATVGGGEDNVASDDWATVGGGLLNAASGAAATTPGGSENTALGALSFAAGFRAKANHDGTFVWADSMFEDMASSGSNQFIVRASGNLFFQDDSTLDDQGGFINTSTGGFLSNTGVWTDFSSREVKENFAPVDPGDILHRVASLPITSWNYEAQDPSVRHIGPVAEDFHAVFGVGEDPRHIASLDTGGVALAAIQGLNEKVESLQAQLSGGPGAGQASGLGGIMPAIGLLGLAMGIALVGRRTVGGVWPSR